MNNSKPDRNIWEICLGLLCLGLAGLTLWSGTDGLKTGKIQSMGKGVHHEFILKNNTPTEFWIWIVIHFIVAIVFFGLTIFIFIPVIVDFLNRNRRR
jgi:hypothetical protein